MAGTPVTTSKTSRTFGRKALAASALAVVSILGVGGVAAAQDQHAGGESPERESRDPGSPTEVLGAQVRRQDGLPVTGADIAGLVALGAGAVAVGSGAMAVSRRRRTASA